MNDVLFLGNGINRLNPSDELQAISWTDLLNRLGTYCGTPADFVTHLDKKPLTFAYEEIFLFCLGESGRGADDSLTKRIVELAGDLGPNQFHRRIVALDTFSTILTANYDYALEYALDPNYRPHTKKETVNSLKRVNHVGGKSIWHVHGELIESKSLMLGFEHYVSGLDRLSQYFRDREKRKTKPGETWVDIFLHNHIHIVGFSLDYAELDIWWLLKKKAELSLLGEPNIGTTYFYHFWPLSRQDNDELEVARDGVKHKLLESFGVIVKPDRDSETYAAAYDRQISFWEEI